MTRCVSCGRTDVLARADETAAQRRATEPPLIAADSTA
jgi:hypothetical protein